MTVNDLIEHLQKLPSDYIVIVDGTTSEILQKESIEVSEYYKEVVIFA